jgi:hypothetical protein
MRCVPDEEKRANRPLGANGQGTHLEFRAEEPLWRQLAEYTA